MEMLFWKWKNKPTLLPLGVLATLRTADMQLRHACQYKERWGHQPTVKTSSCRQDLY